jgi:probable phosphoglycerate mutase
MSDDPHPPLRIYLIRHGQTEWSLAGRYTGLTDIGLTGFGERESASLAARLGDTVFSQVLASPLRRARHTCTLAGLDAVVEVDHDLVEWDYGNYEGRYSAEVHREYSGWSVFRDGCPEGESVQQVCDRADRVIGRLRLRSGNIAIFSHGQFGRALAMRWLGMPMIQAQHFALDTASISILTHASGQPDVAVIALWNSPPGITADGAGDEVIGMADAGKQSAIQRWENEGGGILHGVRQRVLAIP